MLATLVRHRLDKLIEKYGTDIEIINTGEIMVCEASDTCAYTVVETMDFSPDEKALVDIIKITECLMHSLETGAACPMRKESK